MRHPLVLSGDGGDCGGCGPRDTRYDQTVSVVPCGELPVKMAEMPYVLSPPPAGAGGAVCWLDQRSREAGVQYMPKGLTAHSTEKEIAQQGGILLLISYGKAQPMPGHEHDFDPDGRRHLYWFKVHGYDAFAVLGSVYWIEPGPGGRFTGFDLFSDSYSPDEMVDFAEHVNRGLPANEQPILPGTFNTTVAS